MPQSLRDGLAILSVFLGLFALLFVVVKLFQSPGEAEAVAELKSLSSPDQARTGAMVLVDGRIADSVRPLRGGLVLYKREQSKGDYRNSRKLVTISVGKQSFVIDTVHGPVRVVNEDFAFDDRRNPWAPVERIETPATLTESAIVISGFIPGTPVIAAGRLGDDDGMQVLSATLIAFGPRDAYFAAIAQSRAELRHALPWMAFGGLFLIWIGVRVWRA
ncbi:MAG: hypothetical protein AAFZ01_13830 [Pseudomonadota bacterium]